MSSELSTLEQQLSPLFERVVSILEQARSNVVRSVNHNTVLANWLIGREIVLQLQQGQQRAEYGKQIIEALSARLNRNYGKGFSATNLWYFRQFYLTYPDRIPIPHPTGGESTQLLAITHPAGGESAFSAKLSWSHYRALMKVKDAQARDFYEQEAAASGWDKRDLERQINSQYFQRILASQNPNALIAQGRKQITSTTPAIEVLKNPYVLEFLGLPELPQLHEPHLESAIMTQLQVFLLELGQGFAFVARQKRLQFEDKDLFVDLVFYHCILKCYVLIDLKMTELTHADVGQMDGYIRLFDDQYTSEGDNPTIGLILCAEKNEAVAKYSVLNDRKQIFASKYMLHLPTEQQLQQEIQRELKLIENLQGEHDEGN
jgi:predicted nuclease of restriction endonuclease-like (RecB) superfamily